MELGRPRKAILLWLGREAASCKDQGLAPTPGSFPRTEGRSLCVLRAGPTTWGAVLIWVGQQGLFLLVSSSSYA